MKRLSKYVADYLRDEFYRQERLIALEFNSKHKILSVNRSKQDWKPTDLNRGSILPAALSSLVEAAEGSTQPVVIRFVEIGDQVVDVHVLIEGGSRALILHDVTEAHRKEQELQQRAHEISLLSEKREMLNKQLSELNEELSLSRLQAEKASAAKSRFIASMSHEFRSPITSMMGYANLLRAELPESANPQALQRASWHLLTLVENLLEQAREGDEHVSLNPARFSLDSLAEDIKVLFQAQADAKGLGFQVESSPRGTEIVLDELRLRQVLINLVSNALRYTTEGMVNVRIDYQDGILSLLVRDTGRGIAADDIERIFEPFTQLDDSHSSGAGLGLAITRKLIQRMDGEIEIESQPGAGSVFRVSLPCPRAEDHSASNHSLSGELLWVDDDQDILALYGVLLEDWGLQVHIASSIKQAREVMKRAKCTLIITDMHLADGNGLELLAHFASERPGIQGILVSGSGLTDLPDVLDGGVVRAFLQKPIDLELLRSEISTAFAAAQADHAF